MHRATARWSWRLTIGVVAAGGVLSLLIPATAVAAIIPLSATIDGLQEVAPNVTPGIGFANMSFDTGTSTLSWTINYAGLIGTPTLAHFHGPAPVGVNAGIQVDIPSNSGNNILSPIVGSAVIAAAQASDLLSGLWYINIHSTFDAGGEIRGQVLPEPSAAVLATLGGLGLLGTACRRGKRHGVRC